MDDDGADIGVVVPGVIVDRSGVANPKEEVDAVDAKLDALEGYRARIVPRFEGMEEMRDLNPLAMMSPFKSGLVRAIENGGHSRMAVSMPNRGPAGKMLTIEMVDFADRYAVSWARCAAAQRARVVRRKNERNVRGVTSSWPTGLVAGKTAAA